MQLNQILLFLGNLNAMEIFFIFIVILLLFGAKRIPELARGFGKGIREFKEATKDVKDQITESSKAIEAETDEAKKAIK